MLTLFKTPAVSSTSVRVDRAAGIVRGASIVTTGEARGHDVFVDETTLRQVVDCAARRGDTGVAVKFNANTFNHGPGGVAGSARNFRVVGGQVVADLYLLKSFSEREYLFELIESQPGTFGLSMDFEMQEETIGSRTFARVVALDAVTVVDVPAANNGFFRAGACLPVLSPLFTRRSLQPTMQHTSTGFAAKIKTHKRAGVTPGAAILLARRADPAGFNQWCAAGRPMPDAGQTGGTSTSFAASIRQHVAKGANPGAAILLARNTDRAGFNAWSAAGRPA